MLPMEYNERGRALLPTPLMLLVRMIFRVGPAIATRLFPNAVPQIVATAATSDESEEPSRCRLDKGFMRSRSCGCLTSVIPTIPTFLPILLLAVATLASFPSPTMKGRRHRRRVRRLIGPVPVAI